MLELTDRHKTLIQTLFSRGPLSEKDFHAVFAGVTGKVPGNNQQIFNDYLLKINKELSYVQCELRGCMNQNDGQVFYGIVNKVADDQSQLGTKYSVPQIAYYKAIEREASNMGEELLPLRGEEATVQLDKLLFRWISLLLWEQNYSLKIEAIMHDTGARGCISNIDALNLRLESQAGAAGASQSQDNASRIPAAFRNFSIAQKEKTIEELVRDRWLYLAADGDLGLGVRSFLDLRNWFCSNDIPLCEVCNEAAIKAEMCPNRSCAVRIHRYCLAKRFSQRKVNKACSSCGSEWPYIEPKAEVEEEDDQNIAVSQPPLRSQKRRVRDGVTGDVDLVRLASSQPLQRRRRTTRSSVHGE